MNQSDPALPPFQEVFTSTPQLDDCLKRIDEFIRIGNGFSLDELEYGVDITDEFCAWIESPEARDEFDARRKVRYYECPRICPRRLADAISGKEQDRRHRQGAPKISRSG